jgi:hypothetical protein
MTQTSGLTRVLDYRLADYPFPGVVQELFGCASLDRLHEHYPRPVHANGDQDTPAHALFYREYARISGLYEQFVREVVAPAYGGEELCVQTVPTFRIHYPGALAVREFHRDSDYNHQVGITNYWLPLTPAFATNSIWLETEPYSEQFRPVDLLPGQVLRFDAVQLKHGNHRNDTEATRVSFDFRVLPMSDYRETGLTSVNRGVRLGLESYYMLLTRDGEFRHATRGRP